MLIVIGCKPDSSNHLDNQLISENSSISNADHKQETPDKKVGLPLGLIDSFIIPNTDKDQHGNPLTTRDGSLIDNNTGYAFEIWLRHPSIEFILIPAGSFVMGASGSEECALPYERPVHRVTFDSPFYMSKYEVTQRQWRAVIGNNPSFFEESSNSLPVEQVTWENCQEFIIKLNNLSKISLIKYESHMRLPSEAEWEYACRSGTMTRYYIGEAYETLAQAGWFLDNSDEKTHPVGKKSPNRWGLFDMHGNVFEWCADNWSNNYEGSPTDGSALINDKWLRTARGGSWRSYAQSCRSASRSMFSPGSRVSDLGFRIVKPLP